MIHHGYDLASWIIGTSRREVWAWLRMAHLNQLRIVNLKDIRKA